MPSDEVVAEFMHHKLRACEAAENVHDFDGLIDWLYHYSVSLQGGDYREIAQFIASRIVWR